LLYFSCLDNLVSFQWPIFPVSGIDNIEAGDLDSLFEKFEEGKFIKSLKCISP